LLWHMDEPFHTAAVYGHWKLMELTRNAGIPVVLDGSGGDEALHGYHYSLYPSIYLSLLREGRPVDVVREAAWRRQRNGVSVRQAASEALRFALPFNARAFRRPPWIDSQLPIPPRPLAPRALQGRQLFGLTVSPLPLHNRLDDRSSMSFSVEMRNPFLDYRLVECGLALGARDLLRRGLSKWVLREGCAATFRRQSSSGLTNGALGRTRATD
jgi:asparagine synthase (glutamine-hydrolysing)